ncbi:MAG TPA: hypothetical protein VMB71_15010 [Acetobacteraceae bacterium]|nr:hypothetical protein [Acetobacteraceae bacterium]
MSEAARAADVTPMPFNEFLAHLRTRRPAALRIFSAVVALSLLAAAIVPPRYYAEATLAVLPAPEFTVRQDAGSPAISTAALSLDAVMKAETAILESAELQTGAIKTVGLLRLYPRLDRAHAAWPLRALRALARLFLSPWQERLPDNATTRLAAALRQFESDLEVLPAKDGNVITITMGHKDPVLAAQAVNTLLSLYAQHRQHLYDDPQLAVVTNQVEALSRALKAADLAIAAFKAAHGISDYGAERDLLANRVSAAAQALADSHESAAENAARVRELGHQIAALPKTVSLYRENDMDTRLQAMDASLVDLRARLAATRLHYRERSRTVTDLVAQLHAKLAERRHLASDATPSVARNGRNPALDSLVIERARAATERDAAESRVATLRGEISELAAQRMALTGEEASLAELTRHRSIADSAYASANQVLAERRITEAEDALRLANVRVIQAARVPVRAAPIPLLIVLAGILLGALVAVLWAIADYAVEPTVLTREGLEAATGLPVLAVFTGSTSQSAHIRD